MRYTCIHRRRNLYPVQMMCQAMKVSSSGYYAWRTRPESRRRRYDRELTQAIRLLHAESSGTYGSPRLHAELNDSGFTYLWTNQGWLYLGVVMDLFSRRIIGWSMSRRLSRHLAVNSLNMALDQRQPTEDLIHHSDRGVQYMSDDFRDLLKKNGITCSISGKGSCCDNAVVESFFASLKRERTRRIKYRTRDEARADVFDYIERFYNRKRRHGYVRNISPVLFENRTLGLNSGVHQT